MTYIPSVVFDRRAGELWDKHGLTPGFNVDALIDQLELSLLWEELADEAGMAVLGQLDPDEGRIILNERHLAALDANNGRLARFTVAHEIGHWCFHCEAARSGALSLFHKGRIWCRNGSQHIAERQAEMFAARLLMPEHEVKRLLPRQLWAGWRHVYRLADVFLASPTAMMIRLEELGVGYRDETGQPHSGTRPPLDQERLF